MDINEQTKFHKAKMFYEMGFETHKHDGLKLYYKDDHGHVYGSVSNYVPFVWSSDGTAWEIDTENRALVRTESYDLTPVKINWWANIPKKGILCHFERRLNSGVFDEIKRVMRYKTESNQNCCECADGEAWFVERFKPIREKK